MRQILAGDATPAQIAGFVVALRAKGETVSEVEGLVATMYEFAAPCEVPGRTARRRRDRRRPVATPSTSPRWRPSWRPVRASPVVKHGNRAASSSCGAADVLEGLGVPLDLAPGRGRDGSRSRSGSRSASRRSSTRLCGTRRRPGASSAWPRRSTSSVRWPTRPSRSPRRSGSPTRGWPGSIAGVLAARGVDGLVFRGDDGLDELTTTTTSQVWSVVGGHGHRRTTLDPARPGHRAWPIRRTSSAATSPFNAAVVRDLLAVGTGSGARRRAAQRRSRDRRLRTDQVERRSRLVRTDWARPSPWPGTPSVSTGGAARALSRWLAAVDAA